MPLKYKIICKTIHLNNGPPNESTLPLPPKFFAAKYCARFHRYFLEIDFQYIYSFSWSWMKVMTYRVTFGHLRKGKNNNDFEFFFSKILKMFREFDLK